MHDKNYILCLSISKRNKHESSCLDYIISSNFHILCPSNMYVQIIVDISRDIQYSIWYPLCTLGERERERERDWLL